MPLYEYRCDACGRRFEKIQKFADPPLDICQLCGKGPVRKLLSSPAIQFKGSGWYITDYARKNGSGGETKDETKTDAKTESKAETKTETKTESKTETKPSTSSS